MVSIKIFLLWLGSTFNLQAAEVPDQPLTSPLPARVGTQVVTPDWLLSLPSRSEDRPTIKWLNNVCVIYASPPSTFKPRWTIEAIDVKTKEQRTLGEGSNPIPSPDGKSIAFIKGEKEAKQLWLMDSRGENLSQLSNFDKGISNNYFFEFCWSPDSSKIALSYKPYIEFWEIEREQPKTTISIIELASGKMKQVASFNESVHWLSWFPNGHELLFVREQVGFRHKKEEDHEWVHSLNIHNLQLRTLAKFDGLQQFLIPVCSPDGRLISIMYDADNPEYSYMLSIGLISYNSESNENSAQVTRLTHELKLYSPQWSSNSQYIYALRDQGAYKQIYKIDAKTGKPAQITDAPLNVGDYTLSPDGSQLAWIGKDAQSTSIIRVASNDGSNVSDLVCMEGVPDNMALSEVREIDWQAPGYPARIRGLLVMPYNYQKGSRYPLVVDIHGGGAGAYIYLQGGILLDNPLEWHMWAAKGYAVFVPEFRSSASFGSLAITRDDLQDHDIINCDMKDIEAGIDALIEAGIVDKDRLAAIGHSAGGRRANWLTVKSHRFKAIISKEGWADEWIEALESPPSKRIYKMFGGAPWEVPQNYLKNSALYHANGATTPTLFLMGNPKKGGADRSDTVHKLYNVLKAQNVETEYVKYANEGHVFTDPETRRDALERSIKWIDNHLCNNK